MTLVASNALALLEPPPSVTLRARYEAREAVSLPGFLGGTLHGALGYAVEAVGSTADDVLGPAPVPAGAPGLVRANPAPRAVMIPPPLGRATELATGEALDLAVLLVAPEPARIGVLLAALERIGARGLGKGRGRLTLMRVEDGDGQTVWADGRVLCAPREDAPIAVRGAGPWTLRARTPLHLVRGGALTAHPSVADVIAAAARRLFVLSWTYGRPVDCDLRELEQAARAQLADEVPGDWTQVRGERWSERQRRHHPVEGVMGSLALGARTEPYLELLGRALRFGVGKGTALGLGRLELALRV